MLISPLSGLPTTAMMNYYHHGMSQCKEDYPPAVVFETISREARLEDLGIMQVGYAMLEARE